MYIHRELEKEINPFLGRKEILAIVGPRQVGKTTLLEHLAEKFSQENKRVKFITFEKPSDLALFDSIEDFKDIHKDYQTVIIDEFHYARNGGQKLKYLFDTTRTKYIISGSCSLDLKFQTGKYLVGRMLKFVLRPFSFREYLFCKNPELFELLTSRVKDAFSFSVKRSFGAEINNRLERLFNNYLVWGGYPLVVLAKTPVEKQKILDGILENYLLKDIRSLLQLATENELVKLTRFLAAQIGNLISYKELSNSAGLGYKEVLKHIEILKQTYLADLARPYFTNKRTEIIKNPKVYFIDTGLRNSVLSDFREIDQRETIGNLTENFVFNVLKRKTEGFQDINFWRTKSGAEIDFLLQKNNRITPVEVKYARKPTIGKSVYSFIEKFSPQEFFIFTRGYVGQRRIGKCRLKFIPIYYIN
jgi:predicted AAA+ superfamily ATPase